MNGKKSNIRNFESDLHELLTHGDVFYSEADLKQKFREADFESVTSLEAVMSGRPCALHNVAEADGRGLGLGFNKYFQPYFSSLVEVATRISALNKPRKISLKSLAKLPS